MKKILLMLGILLTTIIVHYSGKAKIYKYSQDINKLTKEESFLADENKNLLSKQSSYLSKERITKIAQTQLNMVFSAESKNSVCIVKEETVKSKTNFVLIDFLVPDANALTK